MSEETIEAIKQTIKETVNGKIDKLTISVNEGRDEIGKLHVRLNEQDVSMKPVLETFKTINSGRKFMVWVAPFAIVGSFIAWFRQ